MTLPTPSRLLRRLVLLDKGEASALLWSTAYFFLLLFGFYLLRPVREAIGIARGADKLPWLMTGTLLAMVLANQMQEQGAQVDILLCDQAGDLALKDGAGEALKPNNVTPAQLLDGALKKGATASVCALYLPNTGKKPEDLKDGIKPAKPADMGAALLEPTRKVIGF